MWGRRLAHLGLALVIIAALVGVCRVADRHNAVFDVSRDGRSSLAQASITVLALLPQPLEVIAFVPQTPALRRGLAEFFARYRRHKPDLRLRYIDPRADLEAARQHGARLGDVVVEYAGRRERIKVLNESETTNALARLARGADRFITFLAGNGERRVARGANHDLSDFGDYLESRGLKLREYTLGKLAGIPGNTAVLVIASPAVAYTAAEIDEINAYVAGGGNLLWLTEPDAPADLAPLERALGCARFPGTIVDPVGLTKLRNPAYAVALTPTTHPVMTDLNQTVAMPYASALIANPNIDWQATTIAATEPQAWNETGSFEGNVGRDASAEVEAAHKLALALTKARADGSTQRVVIVGDGDFLSNAFVDNLGNREFGRRVFEWLASDDALVTVDVPAVPDRVLALELWQRLAIFLFFGVGLPLAFGINGGLRWWRRRNA